MRRGHSQRKIITILSMFAIIATIFVFGVVSAESVCPYHQEHDEACGYVEAIEGQPCSHEHTEECYEKILVCSKEEHTHNTDCYDENNELICTLEEHTHSDICYDMVLHCQHVHDENCGYVEAVEGHECTHNCSYCDKNLVRTGKIEIEAKENEYIFHVESTLTSGELEDQVYSYVSIPENLLDDLFALQKSELYYVVCEDGQELELTPIYFSNHEERVYLRYKQNVNTSIQFDLVFKTEQVLNQERIQLLSASEYNELDQKILDEKVINQQEINEVSFITKAQETFDSLFSTNDVTTDQMTTYAEETPEGIDFSEYITNVTLSKYTSNGWQPTYEVNDGDDIQLVINYTLASEIITQDNRVIYYQLPAGIRPQKTLEGIVYEGNTRKGTYVISEDGLITITFDQEYADGSEMTGSITFNGIAGLTNDNNETETVVIGKDTFTIIPNEEENNYDIAIEKEGVLSEDSQTINYMITVSSENGSGGSLININDTISGGASYIADSFAIKKITTNEEEININDAIINIDDTSFNITNLSALDAGEKYIITYTAKVNPEQANSNGSQTINNTASATTNNQWKGAWESTEVSQQRIYKTGYASSPGEGKIYWEIYVYNPSEGMTITEIFTCV